VSREEIEHLVRRVERSIRSARNLLDDGDYDFAMSRAYYAMFYAATAVLLSRGITRSKHSGVISAFGQEVVKSGEFSSADQRMLLAAFQDRNEGDYAGVLPSRERVEQRLKDADGPMPGRTWSTRLHAYLRLSTTIRPSLSTTFLFSVRGRIVASMRRPAQGAGAQGRGGCLTARARGSLRPHETAGHR